MTMQPQSPILRFIAVVTSPQPRLLYLTHTGIDRSSFGSLDWLGWELAANIVSATGEEQSVMDHWEETFLEILRYPEEYSDQPLDWRWEHSGDPVNLRQMQPTIDESRRFKTAIKTAVAPDGALRLCFNLYDNGDCRFTCEGLIRDRELSAWVPQEWSDAHKDLPSAVEAARKKFDWVS